MFLRIIALGRTHTGLLLAAFFVLVSMITSSCSKDKDASNDDNDAPGRQVSEVVPAAYLKTLIDHGFPVNEGSEPPRVDGKFLISKYRFDYDNHREPGLYPSPGTIMSDLVISFSGQVANQTNIPAFGGGYFPGIKLEDPFITGTGNKFTACFTLRVAGGSGALFVYPFVYLFSGTVEGDVLKNVKVAKVGLEEKSVPMDFSVAGEVDIYSDADGTSPKIP